MTHNSKASDSEVRENWSDVLVDKRLTFDTVQITITPIQKYSSKIKRSFRETYSIEQPKVEQPKQLRYEPSPTLYPYPPLPQMTYASHSLPFLHSPIYPLYNLSSAHMKLRKGLPVSYFYKYDECVWMMACLSSLHLYLLHIE